jgi:CDP-glucose 4,6-dehydratase
VPSSSPCAPATTDAADFWAGRRVLVTGHTGFKGGWLSWWLTQLGAEVHGYALDPPTEPSFGVAVGLPDRLASDTRGDIRDPNTLRRAFATARPETVFHLAAQPLVRQSYRDPMETLEVNVLGTARLLEAVRASGTVRAVVVATTDKCYENREFERGYREDDPLGGADPYSASKACAELAVSAWRRSFLDAAGIATATARAGNVIGGGDWAADRLVPDFLRAIDAGQELVIRSPSAVRPWQHVLEPLGGYLRLAAGLLVGEAVAEGWNFGPDPDDARPVGWLADRLCQLVQDGRWRHDPSPQPHEARLLTLDSNRARTRLEWRPRWTLDEALERTVEWHRAWRRGSDLAAVTAEQVAAYQRARPRRHQPRLPSAATRPGESGPPGQPPVIAIPEAA